MPSRTALVMGSTDELRELGHKHERPFLLPR